ncbi:hypothetical protein, partial [Cellulomonas biazotea]|uniref:hypothetical protein n=1 Tax=Cellulomonas biazotea TaxID=1709 RepID=UPI001030F838
MSTQPDSADRERGAGSDDVDDLLRAYHEVLGRSRRLPGVVWMRTRPDGSGPTAGWFRLPRLTWGTHLFVLFHVERSVRALARAYAARAALDELDAEGRA